MKLRRVWIIVALLAAGVVLAAAAVALVGVTVEASRWHGPIERALGGALGREVRVAGPVTLRLSLWPEVRVGGLAIANPPGFAAGDFATLGELHLAADVLPLLHDELRVRELRAADLEIRLERAADGAGNWVFDRGGVRDHASETARERPVLDIHRVLLERVRIRLGPERMVEVAKLTGEARADGATELAANGMLDGRHAYTATLTAAPLARLGTDQPWTFDALIVLAGSSLAASGAVTGAGDASRVAVRFGAGTPDVRAVARALRFEAPALGAAALAGTLEAQRGRIAVAALNAVVGRSLVTGDLAYDTAGARPRLSGALVAAVLDVLPLLERAPDAPQAEPETLAETFRELERTDLEAERLAGIDLDVQLDIGDLDGLPGDLRDVSLRLQSEAGRARIPLRFMLAGARFEGEANGDVTVAPPRFDARVVARDSPLGGIAEVLFGAPYIDGTFSVFELALAGEGAHPRELVNRLTVTARLDGARLTYGNFEGGEPVRVTIDSLRLAQPHGRPLTATIAGSLLGRRLDGTFQAETVERVIREGRTRFSFDAKSGGVRASLSGLLAATSDTGGSDIDVRIAAARAAELAPWFGFDSKSPLPVKLAGKVQVRRSATSITGGSAAIGASALSFDFVSAVDGGRKAMRLSVAGERIDVAELQTLAPPRRPGRADGLVDIPILPEELDLQDADVDVRVKRIDGLALRLTDVVFSGRLRDGELPASPFSLAVEGIPLSGALAAELRAAVPRVQLWLQGENVDVAVWLRALGLGGNIEATADKLQLHADLRESTLGRAADASSLVANIEQGRFVIRDRNTKAALRVRIEQGEVRADPGEPLRATFTGRIFRAPVTLKVVTGRLRQFLEFGKRMPLDVELAGAGARLTLAGEVAPRVASPDVDLVVGLTGSTLAELAPLLRTSLPPWGPYAGAARLRISSWGYEVENMRLAVGESVLDGRGALNTSGKKPRLDLALDASNLQLDDFPLDQWSPVDAAVTDSSRSMAAQIQEGAAQTSTQVQALLDPAVLRGYDAYVSVDVRQVLSGKDVLGRGRLRGRVEDGGAIIELADVEVPGGSARMTAYYTPRGDSLATRATVNIDRFDYGVVARRADPSSKIAGMFSLNLYVDSTAPRLSQSLRSGTGYLDVVVWPERLDASVFDLWSTNILLAVLPVIGSDVSRLNCWLGELDLTDGKLVSRRLLIDTTNSRTIGAARANLADNSLEMRLVPRPKVPQFFALATPIEVTGTFEDFGVRIRPFDVFETVVRWASSLVVVPFQRLTTRALPADGSDACRLEPRASPALKPNASSCRDGRSRPCHICPIASWYGADPVGTTLRPKPTITNETLRRIASVLPAEAGRARTIDVCGDTLTRMIAEAAYYRAEKRGFVPGAELEDWLAAEAEIAATVRKAGWRSPDNNKPQPLFIADVRGSADSACD